MKSPTRIDMKHCKFYVHHKGIINDRSTVTVFSENYCAIAMRLNIEDNIREANSQGYSGEDAVWKSLVEHEYLHNLISELLYDRPSLVLETESGKKFHPSWLRYQEEAVVIGVQYLLNNLEKIRQGNREGLLGETYSRVNREVYQHSISNMGVASFLTVCQDAITDLWSQIEKDF